VSWTAGTIADALQRDLMEHRREMGLVEAGSQIEAALAWARNWCLSASAGRDLPAAGVCWLALKEWDTDWISTEPARAAYRALVNGPSLEATTGRSSDTYFAIGALISATPSRTDAEPLVAAVTDVADEVKRNPGGLKAGAVGHVGSALRGCRHSGGAFEDLFRTMSKSRTDDLYELALRVRAALELSLADPAFADDRERLAEALVGSEVTRSNFVASCAALRALGQSAEDGLALQLEVTAEAILHCHRESDGSWNGNAWETGWALLALNQWHRVERIILDLNASANIAAATRARVKALQDGTSRRERRARRTAVELCLLSVLLALGVTAIPWALFRLGFGVTSATLGAGGTAMLVVLGRAWWGRFKTL
jgi:hypothetical protein